MTNLDKVQSRMFLFAHFSGIRLTFFLFATTSLANLEAFLNVEEKGNITPIATVEHQT